MYDEFGEESYTLVKKRNLNPNNHFSPEFSSLEYTTCDCITSTKP